jgi:hypothetical protein
MFVYQVLVNKPSGQGPAAGVERLTRTELAVFDVQDGNLVLYIGVPQDKPDAPTAAAAAKARAQRQQQNPPETIPMTWTRHDLGNQFTRHQDAVAFRPPSDQIMPYPVLPLPPTDAGEKDAFQLALPDLTGDTAEDRMTMTSKWRLSATGNVVVSARIEPEVVPGVVPEMGTFTYNIPTDAGPVSRVAMMHREGGQAPAADRGGTAAQRAPAARARGPRPQRKPADIKPPTNVVITLTETRPLSPEQHRVFIDMIQKDASPAPAAADAAAGQNTGDDAGRSQSKARPDEPQPRRYGPRGMARDVGDQMRQRGRAVETRE